MTHRIHRAKKKTVYIKKKLVIDHTEGRILRIQKRKTVIDKEALQGGDKSGKVDPGSLEDLKVIFGDKE
ncbi:hypothetical protein C8R48DRAFT_758802 [Suillus tomentosus]|nr:hypothetical protein C8R48DRAFT_758802 [Suillus tomentosus]